MTAGPAGPAPSPRFPFAAVVGAEDAKLALLLAAVEPALGGVLLRGDKGSAKTTLVRGLAGVLGPSVPFVDLPLGATEERVVGSLDLAAALGGGEVRFQRGLLAAAHGGVLYVDEVNLLGDHLVDVLLDAAATGVNRVERDGISRSHEARFLLVGSMNPEEGELRPQLLDRFGLAVEVRNPVEPVARAEIVRRRAAHDRDPAAFAAGWAGAEATLAAALAEARARLAPSARRRAGDRQRAVRGRRCRLAAGRPGAGPGRGRPRRLGRSGPGDDRGPPRRRPPGPPAPPPPPSPRPSAGLRRRGRRARRPARGRARPAAGAGRDGRDGRGGSRHCRSGAGTGARAGARAGRWPGPAGRARRPGPVRRERSPDRAGAGRDPPRADVAGATHRAAGRSRSALGGGDGAGAHHRRPGSRRVTRRGRIGGHRAHPAGRRRSGAPARAGRQGRGDRGRRPAGTGAGGAQRQPAGAGRRRFRLHGGGAAHGRRARRPPGSARRRLPAPRPGGAGDVRGPGCRGRAAPHRVDRGGPQPSDRTAHRRGHPPRRRHPGGGRAGRALGHADPPTAARRRDRRARHRRAPTWEAARAAAESVRRRGLPAVVIDVEATGGSGPGSGPDLGLAAELARLMAARHVPLPAFSAGRLEAALRHVAGVDPPR